MKRTSLILTLLAALSLAGTGISGVGAASAEPRTPRLDARERRIEQRMHRGARSGQLTRPESRRLRGEMRRLRRHEARFKADGHLSFGERRALRFRARHLSHDVCRLRHNHRHRF